MRNSRLPTLFTRHALAKFLALAVLCLWVPVTAAQLPTTLNYQGRLVDNAGQAVTDPAVSVTIRLYDVAVGGAALWTETQMTSVADGLFSIDLGNTVALTPALFVEPLWLGVSVSADAEMTPRKALTNVAFAFMAGDADSVDGMQATEIIDAVDDYVRTPIFSLPFDITASGSYYLTGNLTGASGIFVTVDDVTIDLMGFTLTGTGAVNSGIFFGAAISNVTIRNGTIRGFGLTGIDQPDEAASYNRVLDVQVIGNGAAGTLINANGIFLAGTNNHIERCTSADNNGRGIYAGGSSLVIGNTVYNNAGDYGIYGGSGATISGNTAYNHLGLYAIYGELGANISDNMAYANQHWGIYGDTSNTIRDNTITFNNLSNTASEGGLRAGSDSRVIGNTVDQNTNYNIWIAGITNVIKGNLVTDSQNGIHFVQSGNYYADNQSANNTNAFVGGVPVGSADGGGNVEF